LKLLGQGHSVRGGALRLGTKIRRIENFTELANRPAARVGMWSNGEHPARDCSPRGDSRVFVGHLSPRHRVTKVILVSGDREAEVRSLAAKSGIQAAYGAKSPEDKVELVREETRKQRTVFVGDGINDASVQAATVGVAFGHESDITSEAADAVVFERSFGKVDELMHIGRRMRRIALESAIGGMALSALGMLLAAYGVLPPIGGAVAQEVIDLVAVLNAVRVALPFGVLRDF
jgi:cation transport ATPase